MVFDVIVHDASVHEHRYAGRSPLDDEVTRRLPCEFPAYVVARHDHKSPGLVVEPRWRPRPGLDDLDQLIAVNRLVGILTDAPAGVHSFKKVHRRLLHYLPVLA